MPEAPLATDSRQLATDHRDLYFQWEVRSWSRALSLWRDALQGMPGDGGMALALGERDGGLSLLLAESGFTTICSDLHGPTEKARVLHRKLGWENSIVYQCVDATSIPEPDGVFDVVAFKSMLGALGSKDRQMQAVHEMHRVLKPGGTLLFAENLHGTALHKWLRKRFIPWDTYWRYLDPMDDRDLFKDFSSLRCATTGFLANLGRSEKQRDLLARLDGVLMPLVPVRQRTIWYGMAVK